RHRRRADDRAGAGLVLDHDRLAELLLQLLAQIAGVHIGGTSGTKWYNYSNWPLGVGAGRVRSAGRCGAKRHAGRKNQRHYWFFAHLAPPCLWFARMRRPIIAAAPKSTSGEPECKPVFDIGSTMVQLCAYRPGARPDRRPTLNCAQ